MCCRARRLFLKKVVSDGTGPRSLAKVVQAPRLMLAPAKLDQQEGVR